ncbi:MAG: endonuclease MutS2 [Bacillota bacterium]|nr:endonuclease MutS2 [Bacillota bacterium]MDW7677880.1 endonuclease MutS2 [Bacillota bacterium]
MNQRALRVLEFQKIIDMLKEECHSPLGSAMAEKLEPQQHVNQIMATQQETKEAETIILQKGSFPLEGLADVFFLLRKADVGSVLDPGQLLTIKRQLALARKSRSHFSSFENRDNMTVLRQTVSQMESVKALEDRIETCILSDTEVSDHASTALRQIRKQIQQKNDAVKSKLNQMIQSAKMQKYLQESLVTIRQGRYVVPVRQEYKSMVPGLVHDQSSSGATLFIEPMAIVELNNQLKELKLKEELEIERILMELTEEVTTSSAIIRINQQMMQLLDFFMAKGRLSVRMKAVAPELSTQQEIFLKNARHPLINSSEVVPITLELGQHFKALVITGPNTGGKTVTLKTAGLLVLMAQSGLHVPADFGTHIGVFDQVFADIGDEQSIEQSLSTFSSHMTNIADILNHFTEKSLVLLDELGAGTDPDEGAALAMAIIDHLINHRTRLIATTHYSELKQYALMNDAVENACVEFDVTTLSPTYRLLIGIPGKSNAFEISQKLGIDVSIIEEAKIFLKKESVAFEDVLQTIDINRKKTDEALIKADQMNKQAASAAEEIRLKQKKLDEQRDKILQEARIEAQQILKTTKREAEVLIQDLKKMQQEGQFQELNRETEKIRQRIRDQVNLVRDDEDDPLIVIDEIQSKENELLKAGDEVKIPSINQSGSIISIEQNGQQALVQVGMMKMSLPVAGLIKDHRQQKQTLKGLQRMIQQKTETSKSEVDVRGTDLEEALFQIDKYLDDTYLSGREQITIIHGIGTGILKRGIQGMLKKHRLVKGFRDGQYGEGGAGVTIVHFKKS